MDHSKIALAVIVTVSSLGLSSASYAEECHGEALIDKFWVDGEEDCIPAERQDNGWGNGDQDAPGGSLENNNAENYNHDNSDGTEGGTVTNSSGNTPPGQNK